MIIIPMKVTFAPEEVREIILRHVRSTLNLPAQKVTFDITDARLFLHDDSQRDGPYNHRLGGVTVEMK